MKKFNKITVFIFVYALSFSVSSKAQNYANARSLGMGQMYTAVARGLAAPLWNPANLALNDRPPFALGLVGAGLNVRNNSFSKKHYDAYVGQYLSSTDIQTILATVPDDGLNLDVISDAQAVGFAVGYFALTVSAKVASNLEISKDYLRLFLEGIRWNESYDIGDNAGEAFGYTSVTTSVAFPIGKFLFDKLYFGANFNYLIGLGYSNVVESSGEFYNGFESQGEGNVKVRYAQGGSGFSGDIGFAAKQEKWTFGFSLRNVFSNINWDKDTEQFEAYFYTDGAVNVENSSDKDSVIIHDDRTVAIDPFSTTLPSEIQFGIARQGSSFLIAFDYHQGFSERPGVTSKPYFGFGTEWSGIGFFPLRFGLGFGGRNGVSTSTGFGLKLGFIHIDAGVSMGGGLVPSKAKAIGFALSTAFVF